MYSLLKIGRSFTNSISKNIYTNRQKKYIDILNDNNINLVVSYGPAGSGKSMLACKTAIDKLSQNKIEKIIITRPIVPVEGEELGFLPGDINEKMNPWIQPLYNLFIQESSKQYLNEILRNGKLDIVPIGYMRGRTFNDCFVIADEMQNSSPSQMKMLLTRIGTNSKLVMTGDITQCDLLNSKQNGLDHFLKLLQVKYKDTHLMYKDKISTIQFKMDDVKRSDFVKKILSLYEK
tara:strand:+ start:1835 stop:2536 length:702 start_codon:yes stop_codon:yes gene_type:complete